MQCIDDLVGEAIMGIAVRSRICWGHLFSASGVRHASGVIRMVGSTSNFITQNNNSVLLDLLLL